MLDMSPPLASGIRTLVSALYWLGRRSVMNTAAMPVRSATATIVHFRL